MKETVMILLVFFALLSIISLGTFSVRDNISTRLARYRSQGRFGCDRADYNKGGVDVTTRRAVLIASSVATVESALALPVLFPLGWAAALFRVHLWSDPRVRFAIWFVLIGAVACIASLATGSIASVTLGGLSL